MLITVFGRGEMQKKNVTVTLFFPPAQVIARFHRIKKPSFDEEPLGA